MVYSADATAFSNQRKLDRFQNGNLVMGYRETSFQIIRFMYSTDNGVTWQSPGTGPTDVDAGANFSFFIDQDDYIHLVWKQVGTGGGRTDGFIYYMRGTPNAGRTSWTWSAAQNLQALVDFNYPDVVAHREGTGWVAHCVYSYATTTPSNNITYRAVTITSGGVISVGAQTNLSAGYGVNVHTFPSIDFNHTGDGKTVAGGTPHLYAAWSAGGTGAGKGIRFRKAVYAAGAWTWNTEREIVNDVYINDTNRFVNCLFDGTRVIIGGHFFTAAATERLRLYTRDSADTTTVNNFDYDPSVFINYSAFTGSMSYDALGNVYFIGRSYTAANSTTLYLTKWTRETGAVTSQDLGPTGGTSTPYVSMKRGYSNGRVEWVYTHGNNSPYAVKYDYVSTAPFGFFIKKVKSITDLYREKMKARGFNI